MANSSTGQEMHKMSLEHSVVPEIKEVLQNKTKRKETNCIERSMSEGHRGEQKELPTAQAGTIWATNKAILGYNLKYKINIHESILIQMIEMIE